MGRATFGWATPRHGNSFPLSANCCFSFEHDASPYLNDTGRSVAVDQIVLIALTGGIGASVQCALYADPSGAIGETEPSTHPGVRLGETDTITVAAGDNVFTLATPVTVPPGATVFCAVRTSVTLQALGVGSGWVQYYKSAAWPTAFTDPFGVSSGFPVAVPAQLRGEVKPTGNHLLFSSF